MPEITYTVTETLTEATAQGPDSPLTAPGVHPAGRREELPSGGGRRVTSETK